jgi:putative membrane-bound dehydrogenase-like protein
MNFNKFACRWWFPFGASLLCLVSGVVASFAIDVGVAKVDITPTEPIRLTGYGGRTAPSVGVEQKLWAKALVLGNDQQGPAVLLTVENGGISEETYQRILARLSAKAGIPAARAVVSCSHTHTGPCTTGWAPNIFSADIPEDQQAVIDRYTDSLVDKLEQVTLSALKGRQPSTLSWLQGSVGFARNRRTAGGPVDHAMPVLKVEVNGIVRAIVANYACHCTTLSGAMNQTCGDWVGYAQEVIELDHPGAVALITIGCGADANPSPRGGEDKGLAFAKQHGEAIASEVRRLLGRRFISIQSELTTRLEKIELPFDRHFTRAEWQERATKPGVVGYHAKKWLARLDRGEKLPETLPYYVQSWTFGEDLALVFLAGEVVVDYATRLKQIFDPDRLWVTAYANYVPCYIPSRRILSEGGYEAEGSLWYYDRPTRLSPKVEDQIIQTVETIVPTSFRFDRSKVDAPDPKSPQDALATFRLDAGFDVELVVSEPLIQSPVAIDWGPDGRLWVCEMIDYPSGVDGKLKPGGRVTVLSSRAGDGRYDEAKVFLDGLSFPTAVLPLHRGVLICSAPNVLYAEDTNGDGRADLVRTNLTGFAAENPRVRVNGFRWGLDGWFYGSGTLVGGKVKSLITGKEVDLEGRDFRYRPETGEIEPVAGSSQTGRVRDDFGNWFGCDDDTLLWHYPLNESYMQRNPGATYPDPRRRVVGGPDGDKLYPASRTLKRFNDPSEANRVTSASGPCIFREELFGPSYYGNAFVCDPAHNVVTRRVLHVDGVSYSGFRAAPDERSEFLASTDNWFRPVQVRTGPDGALWVVDMYRSVIEHPSQIPAARLKDLDVRAGAGRGRIYRVYPRESLLRRIPDVTRFSDEKLVTALEVPNGTVRDLVHRELYRRKLADQGDRLAQLASAGTRPATRVLALSALCSLVVVDDAFLEQPIHRAARRALLQGLQDKDMQVVRAAIELSNPYLGQRRWATQLVPAMQQWIGFPNRAIQFQLALTFGESPGPDAAGGLIKLLGNDDPWVEAAILSSAFGRSAAILEECLKGKGSLQLAKDLLLARVAAGDIG